ncbi:uncharacterized protein L969DRAFT_45254 [Mixia osmundae IAM 14324]|uniref:Oxo-4-hydroxy-4-carboxy-5-ureidoimidazoline decarboxylase domain-containing protein n=1 Tax=Mixia osmundae (strain CBS 9802 / IAM 14324 / JCM 22182 / KY 12970) TaxID=764103 RepID=G7DXC0_MIXOS|nr:uncharacterized protein L969DRAFT_45254 [Mixia osmundae IAM 14324]KEI41276.1 hypothetical protein L969DRAFT_45254 [Mixia osmundae IAM 14324]GAA95230.1 hypothetical protein E5Q_01886 [Mixia osmundae IAM 14324]
MLPKLEEVQTSQAAVLKALDVLLEPCADYSALDIDRTAISSYHDLLQQAWQGLERLDDDTRANLVRAHPRIGEVGNLSTFSAAEQTKRQTPPEVLAKLSSLNQLYEARYTGLQYVTFVNGRSRAEIAEELEQFLGLSSNDTSAKDTEGISSTEISATVARGSPEWHAEVQRALQAVWQIAYSRLDSLELS